MQIAVQMTAAAQDSFSTHRRRAEHSTIDSHSSIPSVMLRLR
ncbi:MAG: hypothetical protein AB7O68_09235 [Pirellulales bacterium]